MLIGGGAEAFAWQLGYEFVPNQYFQTDRRRRQLALARELEQRPVEFGNGDGWGGDGGSSAGSDDSSDGW